MSRALEASGATIADAREFRGCGGNGSLKTSLAGSPHVVWDLPERRLTAVRPRKWLVAARLGPQAGWDATKYALRVGETPPAVRRPSLCEAINFSRAPRQIGAPAAMNTDASFGFSRMGYPPPFVALAICDCETNVLLRMEGAPMRQRNGGKSVLRRHGAGRLSVEMSVFAYIARVSRISLYRSSTKWGEMVG